MESSEKFKLEEYESLNLVVIKETLQKQLEAKLEQIDRDIEKSQQKIATILEEIFRKEKHSKANDKKVGSLKSLNTDKLFHEN